MLETLLSVAMLGAFIWALRSRVPSAIQAEDTFALVCALLTAALALLGWLFIGVGVHAAT
jgi:hypothetical protein